MKKLLKVLDIITILLFSVYVLLDAFLIPQAYEVVEETSSTEESVQYSNTTLTLNQEKEIEEEEEEVQEEVTYIDTDNEYQDENIHITLNSYRYLDTTIYVADVELSSIDYLKTAFANNTFGKNVTAKTSEIASSVDALLAINGDFYGAREAGYVLRNGVVYRNTAKNNQEDLVIDSEGNFSIINESEVALEGIENALQIFSFGPALIKDGEVVVGLEDEVGKAMASNPRTAICQVSDLHYLLVVSDGRTNESTGLSLYELASFLDELGVETAYNLDGGGSSTMYFNGQVVNNPTTSGRSIKERSVSDVIYIK